MRKVQLLSLLLIYSVIVSLSSCSSNDEAENPENELPQEFIYNHEEVIMGAVNNNESGSVYLGTDGTVHSVMSTDIPQEKVAFVYNYGTTDASFAAPYNEVASDWYPSISEWDIKNQVYFMKVSEDELEALEYDYNTLTPEQLTVLIDQHFTEDIINDVEEDIQTYTRLEWIANDEIIIYQEKQRGFVGILKVQHADQRSDGEIRFSAKGF